MEHFSMRLRTHAKKLSARQTRRCCGLASAKETPFVSASAIAVGQSQDSSSRRGTGVSVRRRSTGSKARGKVNASQKANRGARKGLPSCRVRAKGNRASYQYQSPRNKVGIWERAYRWLEDNDLARRSLITVVAVITSRLCFLLPIPGLDKRFLTDAFANGPLIGVKDPFSGFLETPGNLFQVGFTPIVFSSIVTMTLCASVPYLKQKRREGGAGEIFLKNLQLYIFLVFAVIWSVVTTGSIAPYKIFGSNFEIFSTLLCGSLILKTMCTLIDTYGIGDGFLNILVANIIIEYMVLFRFTLARFMQGQLLLPQLLGLFASVICCVLASAWLIGSTVNLPIKYYATDQEVADGYGSKESYLPFKLNPTGMQPLIMAQCVLQAPTLFANMFRNSFWFGLARFLEQPSVFIPVYFLLLFSSAFLDVSETSKEISLWMSKIGALVPGVRPGQSTTDYVENFRRKTIVKGGLMLSTLGTASLLVESYFKTSMGITFSLTSMLLLVAAFVTVRRQVISYQQAPKLEATIKEYEKVMDSAMKSPFQ